MSSRNRKHLYRAGLAILGGCVLCLLANVILVVAIRSDRVFRRDVRARTGIGMSTEILHELRREGNELERSLLVDSILSIVQGYYVDSERVSNRDIIFKTIDALSEHPEISFKERGDTLAVTVGKVTKIFSFSTEPSYKDTLRLLVSLTQSIDNHLSRSDDNWHEKPEVSVINALLTSLDAHSGLLSPESYKELRQGTEGSFGGLGVLVGIREQMLTVIKPLPHSPALRAGVLRHDRILSIDGIPTFGYTLDDLVEYMRGEPGTIVRLKVLRDGIPYPKLVNMVREIIKVDSVEPRVEAMATEKFLHLTVENFSSRTSDEVQQALVSHRERYGAIDGVILDLRSNPGGLLDQAVAVSDIFIEDGVLLTTKGRRSEVETASGQSLHTQFPMVVLINGDSASASEIVAGALQDHNRAIILGEPSFGKGSVQTIFELPGSQALKLTIARYYTPLGRSIQNVGIKPDVWLAPVLRRQSNSNLLGDLRYKNERYLRNRLEAVVPQALHADHRSKKFKAYYLVDREFEAYEVEPPDDVELQVSKKLLAAVAGHYGDNLPREAFRAGHWLALAAPTLRREVDRLNTETSKWLAKKFSLAWGGDMHPTAVSGASLELQINQGDFHPVEVGSKITLPWKLINRSSRPVDRVSVFVNSGDYGFETKEVLIGTLKAGELKSGFIEIKVPPIAETGHLNIRTNCAVDAEPVKTGAKTITLILKEKSTVELDTYAELADEVGGAEEGTLEPNETARIRLVVANHSSFNAKNVKVKLVNLSGAQVDVVSQIKDLGIIPGGREKVFFIDIKGAEHIYSSELGFGLSLESEDLLTPMLRSINLSGRPNMTTQKSIRAMSH